VSKALLAVCDAEGKVTTVVGAAEIEADILSEGKQESAGIVLLDGTQATYITSNASDIKALIERIVAIVEKIELIATGVDAASNSPGGQTANITVLTLLRTQLNSTKDLLK